MLYLVSPDGLQWTANVGQELVDFARDQQKDLGIIDSWWQPAETRLNEDHVRAALRWGLASQRGIVVAVRYVVGLQRPHELAQLVAENRPRMKAYRESAQVRMVDDYLEGQMPGWKEHGKQLDADVERSMDRSLEEAVKDAERELKRTQVNPDLRSHWLSLGGTLPNPE